jgi:glycosyltransferase involved in cell wall biosynthesis
MKLSIIIPVYNEEETIAKILHKVKKVSLPGRLTKEIIVINDASTDKTTNKLKGMPGIKVLHHSENKGKGAAVWTGMKRASGDIILIQDADLEYDPQDYPRLLRPILSGRAGVVYGSRLKQYSLKIIGEDKTPLLAHYFGNKLLTFVTNVLFGGGLTDMETCYKVFKKSVLKNIKLKSSRFEFEPEVTAKILKRGYKIVEVPIKVKPRNYSEGKKISWRDGFIALWTLFKYRVTD